MNGIATYSSSEEALKDLAQKYGSAVFTEWQTVRKKFCSYLDYPEAGLVQASFFSAAPGTAGTTFEDSNIPKPGSFGQQHLLLKAVCTRFVIQTWDLYAWDGTDASTLYSDLVMGFVQAGVINVTINNRQFVQNPKPFMYNPPGDGEMIVKTAGVDSLTLTEGTPNTLLTFRTAAPFGTQNSRCCGNMWVMDPQVMIEAEQNLNVTIDFPSGAVPVIGTGITNDDSNPLQIGVIFDGVLFRPLQ
jgi:hypothetical protein